MCSGISPPATIRCTCRAICEKASPNSSRLAVQLRYLVVQRPDPQVVLTVHGVGALEIELGQAAAPPVTLA